MKNKPSKEINDLVTAVKAASGIDAWRGTQFTRADGSTPPAIILDTQFLFPDRIGFGPHKEAHSALIEGLRAFNEKHGLPSANGHSYQKNTIYQYSYDHSGGHVDAEGSTLIITGETIEDLKHLVSIITEDQAGFQEIMKNMLETLPKEPKPSSQRPVFKISQSGGENYHGTTDPLGKQQGI